MPDKLRWGILGVAKINDRLLPAFRRVRNGELRAIASRSQERAEMAARAAGIPRGFGSYEQLLDDPEIDAVYIPLPNHLHAEWTRQAADRGKHVLCEKPLTPTANEAREVVAYCHSKNVRLMDGFMWPHHPRTQQLRRLIDDGSIGDVRLIKGAFTFLLEPDPANIRLRPDTAGGSLLDVGCYTVYGIRWAFGAEPASVVATASMHNGVDLSMNGLLKFAAGRVGEFDCGFTLPLRGWLEIAGTRGVIRVPEMWLPGARAEFYVQRGEGPFEEFTVPGHDQIQCMLEDFAEAVFAGREASPNPDEAAKTLAVLNALTRSAAEGREVVV